MFEPEILAALALPLSLLSLIFSAWAVLNSRKEFRDVAAIAQGSLGLDAQVKDLERRLGEMNMLLVAQKRSCDRAEERLARLETRVSAPRL